MTEQASLRRQWLVNKVNEDGMLSKSEMGTFLQVKNAEKVQMLQNHIRKGVSASSMLPFKMGK